VVVEGKSEGIGSEGRVEGWEWIGEWSGVPKREEE